MDLISELNDAVICCNLAEVKRLVTEGVNFSGSIDDKGQTVLHAAAYSGSPEIVEYFISLKKPDVNSLDLHNWTPLLCAASAGHPRICSILLQYGADPKISSDQKTTPLHYLCRKACEDGQPKEKALSAYFALLDELITKGVDINAQNYLGETALMQACSRGNQAAVEFLLNKKAKTNIANAKGETAEFYASKIGNEAIVKLLAEKGKENNKKSLLTHSTVKLEVYSDVVALMKHSDYGVTLKDRKSIFVTHHNCFVGSDLVDWMIKNLPIRTREEATEYGIKLLQANWISSVNRRKKFKDVDNAFYKFSTGEKVKEDQIVAEVKQDKVGIEDFEQLKVLGKGGFGKVMLVRKKDTGKIYALKMMEKARIMNKPRDFKNLMSEKKILVNDSAFLVHLHWAFQTETDFILVMDFVGGGDLYYHWKKQKSFPEKTVQFFAAELVLALSYLHSCGIIYRDLKPQNILLGLDGHICLADFGLSKEVQSTEMGIHTACGTPTYSAPEVIEGSPYGKAIDYWSLGVVLYQFMVGKPPFEFDGDFAKLLRSIYSTKIKYPRQFMSVNAASFLDGLLQRDVSKRLDEPETIKRHPFFKGLEWEKIEVKKWPSPIKITSSEVSQNFDPKYTAMPVEDKNDKKKQPAPEVPDFSIYFGE